MSSATTGTAYCLHCCRPFAAGAETHTCPSCRANGHAGLCTRCPQCCPACQPGPEANDAAALAGQVVAGYVAAEGPVPDAATLERMIELAIGEALLERHEPPGWERMASLRRLYNFRVLLDSQAEPVPPAACRDPRDAIVAAAIAWHGLWGHTTAAPTATFSHNRHWLVCKNLCDAVARLQDDHPEAVRSDAP